MTLNMREEAKTYTKTCDKHSNLIGVSNLRTHYALRLYIQQNKLATRRIEGGRRIWSS